MHLVQLLIPAEDVEGRTYPRAMYEELARLENRFGQEEIVIRAHQIRRP